MHTRLLSTSFRLPIFSHFVFHPTHTAIGHNFSYPSSHITRIQQHYHATMKLTGSCYCRNIKYELNLNSADDARTSLCHCKNCKVC